jgi:hypothetical protein
MKNEGSVQTVGQNEQGQQEVKDIKGIYITKVLEGKKPVARVVQDPHEAFGTLVKTITGATLESKSAVLLSLVPADLQPTLQTMDIGSQKVVTVGTQSAIVYLAGRVDGSKEMTASHILIQYKGAERADATVTLIIVSNKYRSFLAGGNLEMLSPACLSKRSDAEAVCKSCKSS